MKRSALVVGMVAALGLSAPALAQQLEWVNGRGDASGHWREAEYRIVGGKVSRVDAPSATAQASRRPALSYGELARESENNDTTWEPTQPRYRLADGRLALQNPSPSAPRERVTMNAIEHLYPDFSKGA